ncbi:MAG: TonB-dependent receptor [Chitinophagales bacterium]|nr:TonB-dependent receptor [Chitinophagales bacterium]
MKYFLIPFFTFLSLAVFSQTMEIKGIVQDSSNRPLPYAVVMAIRLSDSLLMSFTRTDNNGFFNLNDIAIDTCEITVSHQGFGDKTFYVFGSKENSVFDFGKFSLPPKSITLKEVVIYAFKDPVYYKGDTLVYTADSFKVKPNATVEDLLKKLPGIKVDAAGKITSNGTQIDQVLVDGDEFFGSDQTIATRNLNAENVQSVQLYDKKNENAGAGENSEPLKIMDLKLKEDSKKGYFGKASAASDLTKFYEGELLANKFKGRQKVSAFALFSNTPNSSIGWGDAFKYGLTGDMNTWTGDNGETYYWQNNGSSGIPKALKTGLFYSGKLGKKTKLTANYTYKSLQVQNETATTSQYFLTDTTYKTNNLTQSFQKSEPQSLNLTIIESLDSVTDLELQTKLSYSPVSAKNKSFTEFFTESDMLTRSTSVESSNKTDAVNLSENLKFTRRFKKQDRLLVLNYSYTLSNNKSEGFLKSFNNYYYTAASDSINQKRTNSGKTQVHYFSTVYTESLKKKIKLEFSYDFNYSFSSQDIHTLDFINGEYNAENFLLTNNFTNKRYINRAGIKFIYESKKQRLNLGARLRNVELISDDLVRQNQIKQSVNNILPYGSYTYNFSNNRRLNFQYNTNSVQPAINQLQPVPDNSDPDYINIGNPDLLPTYSQQIKASYTSYKPISGSYTQGNLEFKTIHNDISNSVHYDSIGRTITQPINVNGNYYINGWINMDIPLFSDVVKIGPDVNFDLSKETNFINGKKNITKNTSASAGLDLSFHKEKVDISMDANFDYTVPSSSLNRESNLPYSSQNLSASLYFELPYKLKIESNADYTINNRRTQGYNINYFIWNVSLSETFFKKENLIVSMSVNDLLNQNIDTRRTIQDNVIIDTKSNVVGRYYLLKVLYKFTSNKTKEDDEDN